MRREREDDEELEIPTGPGPGSELRKAREALNLTAQDIAARLNMDVKTILAVEEDRYEALTVPAYGRGYIRAYARLVQLDPDPLIAAYNARAGEAPPLAPFASQPATQAHAGDRIVKAVSYLVAAALITLLVLWWHNQYSADRPDAPAGPPIVEEGIAPPPAAPPSVGRGQAGGMSYDYPIVDHTAQTPAPPGPGVAGAPAADSPAPATDAPAVAGVAPPPAPGTAPQAEAAGPQPADAAAPAGAPGIEPPQDPAAGTTAQGDAAAATPAAPADSQPVRRGPERDIDLKLSGDAWIEIYDASGEKLFFNLGKAGQIVSVRGRTPLRVLIGNAPKAMVLVDGTPVDVNPFAFQGVARFIVNENGLAAAARD